MKKIIYIAMLVGILFVSFPGESRAERLWYSDEETARIDGKFAQMQAEIDELKRMNSYLESRLNTQPISSGQTIVTQSGSVDVSRITALENRVATLEATVNILKVGVINGLNTTIELLKKVLALQ